MSRLNLVAMALLMTLVLEAPSLARAEQPLAGPVLYRLVLETPAGAAGSIELAKLKDFLPEGAIRFQDGGTQWTFRYTKMGLVIPTIALGIILTNNSQESMEIDWNKTVIVDGGGKIHRVIHAGIKMADSSAIMAPSVVPPNATLEEFIYPADLLFFVSGWLGRPFFESLRPGQTVSVSLTVTTGEHTASRRFMFRAAQ